MRTMRGIRLLALAMAALLAVACSAQPSTQPGQGQPSSGASAPSGASVQPIKIGTLTPLTGGMSLEGTGVVKGVELFLKQNGGMLGGRPVQLVKEDSEAKADVGLTKAKKLVENDKVDLIIGPVNSAVALAVKDYITQSRVPMVVPIATTEALTRDNPSPYIFRVQVTATQANKPFGEWIAQNTPYRKIAIVASDFAAGHDAAEGFTAGFVGAGGSIAKVLTPKLGEADFAPYLSQLQGLGVDAVYGWLAGSDAIKFDTQYQEFGLKDKLPLIGFAGLTEDFILPTVKDAAEGIVVATPYTASIDLPENKAFVAAFQQEHNNALPALPEANGYIASMVVDAAIASLGGDITDQQKLLQALAATKLDKTPRGPISFDQNRQAIATIYIARAEMEGNGVHNRVIDKLTDIKQ